MVLDSGPQSFQRTPKGRQETADMSAVIKREPERKVSDRNGLRPHYGLSCSIPKTVTSSVTRCKQRTTSRPDDRSSRVMPSRCCIAPLLNGQCSWMRRSESSCSVNSRNSCTQSRIRNATSLPHIAKYSNREKNSITKSPCLLVALRPSNIEEERERFFSSGYMYNPQFEYAEQPSDTVLDKYNVASDRFLTQAVRIMQAVLKKYGTYENYEIVTGGNLLSKSKIWSCVRKYLQKESCVGEVVVQLTEDLLSQAVMMVENCRPTLTINLAGARQYWLEGMLRHEIGTHYLRGINNNRQPWHSSSGRKQYGLKPANPTEEGLASLHSVLFRKYPFLWRAALLYYTVYKASHMTFSQLFHEISQFVQDPCVRWEYCVRAKRGQTDTAALGCFSKDQVYLEGVLQILRHRKDLDFKLLVRLGKVSYEDVDKLRLLATLDRTRIPHFMMDQERYVEQLDHIVAVNGLNDDELCQLIQN
ncbi:uncharacterized protein KIAA0895-like homolog [Protopterus annectens]|uniref:uncharacterized protein KIAA0895-like homolog n=1 Tax=Protopterus annectens TaxID=7888 RepID=UPI001CF9AC40|nr:uncharacterized protein KIAA0895-like homolog [Protopterus annectens]